MLNRIEYVILRVILSVFVYMGGYRYGAGDMRLGLDSDMCYNRGFFKFCVKEGSYVVCDLFDGKCLG